MPSSADLLNLIIQLSEKKTSYYFQLSEHLEENKRNSKRSYNLLDYALPYTITVQTNAYEYIIYQYIYTYIIFFCYYIKFLFPIEKD